MRLGYVRQRRAGQHAALSGYVPGGGVARCGRGGRGEEPELGAEERLLIQEPVHLLKRYRSESTQQLLRSSMFTSNIVLRNHLGVEKVCCHIL